MHAEALSCHPGAGELEEIREFSINLLFCLTPVASRVAASTLFLFLYKSEILYLIHKATTPYRALPPSPPRPSGLLPAFRCSWVTCRGPLPRDFLKPPTPPLTSTPSSRHHQHTYKTSPSHLPLSDNRIYPLLTTPSPCNSPPQLHQSPSALPPSRFPPYLASVHIDLCLW
jgi:hypothetical protein